MGQRAWRRPTHQEQQHEREQKATADTDEILDKVIRGMEKFMAGYTKFVFKYFFPVFIVFMIYQLAKAG